MKQGFLKKNKIFGINLLYILSLIPVIIFGYYKNGYLMNKNGYMTLFKSTQYFVIPVIIIILSYIFEAYYYLGIKKEEDNAHVFNSIVPYANTLCYLVCGPMDYLWLTIPIIIVLDIILKFVEDKISINQVALFKILLFIILSALGWYNNANLYEAARDITLDVSDYFIGRGVGCIGTTSALCTLIGFVILIFNSYYKKDTSLTCILGYAIVGLLVYFVGGVKFNDILINTFSSGFLFVAIYVVSMSNATPVVKGGRLFYGFLLGIICAVCVLLVHFEVGMYIAILVLGLLSPLFNKFKISLD